jgi:hypothetical protein
MEMTARSRSGSSFPGSMTVLDRVLWVPHPPMDGMDHGWHPP